MASAEELVFLGGVIVTIATAAAVAAARRDGKKARHVERDRHASEHLKMEENWQGIARQLAHDDRNQTQMIVLMKDQAAIHEEAILELFHLSGEIDPDARERLMRRRPDLRRVFIERRPIERRTHAQRSEQED